MFDSSLGRMLTKISRLLITLTSLAHTQGVAHIRIQELTNTIKPRVTDKRGAKKTNARR